MKRKHSIDRRTTESIGVGARFGKLIFTGNWKNNKKNWFAEYRCDCGNIIYRRPCLIEELIYPASCGCSPTHHSTVKKLEKYGVLHQFHIIGNQFHNTAKQRKHDFNLSLEYLKELWEIQNGKCFYSGLDLFLPECSRDMVNNNAPSIDRIDSNLNYVEGNVVFCRKHVNIMKQSLSIEQFLLECKKVYNVSNKDNYIVNDFIPTDKQFKYIILLCKPAAKSRNINFNLDYNDIKELWNKQLGLCKYTHDKFVLPDRFKDIFGTLYPSVDRIDPKLDYTIDNVQLVSKWANMAKWKMSDEEFINYCELITSYNFSCIET